MELAVVVLSGAVLVCCCRISANRWYRYLVLLLIYTVFLVDGFINAPYCMIHSTYIPILLLFACGCLLIELLYYLKRRIRTGV